MAKKEMAVEAPEEVMAPAMLSDDFGREDLNRLRDVVNALIARG